MVIKNFTLATCKQRKYDDYDGEKKRNFIHYKYAHRLHGLFYVLALRGDQWRYVVGTNVLSRPLYNIIMNLCAVVFYYYFFFLCVRTRCIPVQDPWLTLVTAGINK